MIEQLSVFLENEKGRLATMCRVLGDAGFNMHALVVADTSQFGVARVICDRPHSARRALEAAGFAVSVTKVIAVEVPDTPGRPRGVARAARRGRRQRGVPLLLRASRRGGGGRHPASRGPGRPPRPCSRQAGFSLVRAAQIYEPDAAGSASGRDSGLGRRCGLVAGAPTSASSCLDGVEVLDGAHDRRGDGLVLGADDVAHAGAHARGRDLARRFGRVREQEHEAPVVEPSDVVDEPHVVAHVVGDGADEAVRSCSGACPP